MANTFQTVNPATEKVLHHYSFYSDASLQQMLGKADERFKEWRKTSFKTRKHHLQRLAEVTQVRLEEFALLMTREMGKTITESRSELQKCILLCNYYLEEGEAGLAPQHIKTDNSKSYVRFDPLGVVLGIMPWNFPFWQAYRYALPAIFAGNTTLLKHALNTTACALKIQEVFEEAGYPEGVFQTILADNEQVATLIEDTRIQGVTLTGSEQAGSAVAAQAGKALKKTVLELGGSDPFIVLADADIKKAAQNGAKARMMNSGQSCIAAKRFLVEKSVKNAFVEAFRAEVHALRQGNPESENTDLSCLARTDLSDKLEKQIQDSVKKGAKLLFGGERNGNFFMPAMLTNITPAMPAYHEEFFGPVALLFTFETEEELLHVANATDYGLGASIWTQDLERAERLATKIESGSVFINQMVRSDPKLPFGGIKRSGYGRELSEWGLQEFVNIKTVVVE